MAQIENKPGVTGKFPTLTLTALDANAAPITGTLNVPAMKDIKVGNAPKFVTWNQLDTIAELSAPTTKSATVTATIVVDKTAMFGNTAATSGSALKSGIWGLNNDSTAVTAVVTIDGDVILTGNGYLGGTELTTSGTEARWTSPLTINLTGNGWTKS